MGEKEAADDRLLTEERDLEGEVDEGEILEEINRDVKGEEEELNPASAVEEPVKCKRCQRQRRKRIRSSDERQSPEREKKTEEASGGGEEGDEGGSENEEQEEKEDDEERGSSSDYSSIFSSIQFRWEEDEYQFLDLCDPGTMEGVFHREKVPVTYDIYGKTLYLRLCDELRIPVIVRFYNALATPVADLSFHGISKKQMHAVCSSLEMNQHVEFINLRGNLLSPSSCSSLAMLLLKNNNISHLDLTGCRLGPEGAEMLARGLKDNEGMKELNLTKCYIGDDGMKSFVFPLRGNYVLERLLLSHNNLGAEAAESLGSIFSSNNSITHLNADNNDLFDPLSMRKFFRGASVNMAIAHLSLRWNAISSFEVSDAAAMFLRRNRSIKFFDLSDNRLDSQSVRPLKRGIVGSQSLQVLGLARNPLLSEDVEFLVPAAKNCATLKVLNFQDIWVRKEFLKVLKKVQAVKEVEVVLGGIYSNYMLKGPDYSAIILKRARFEAMKPKSKSARRDCGHLMFMLGDEPLTTDQFMEVVAKFKAKISPELLPELIKQFAIPKANLVDVVAMRNKYLSLFPESTPPEQAKPKKSDREDGEKPEREKKEIDEEIKKAEEDAGGGERSSVKASADGETARRKDESVLGGQERAQESSHATTGTEHDN